MKILYHQLTNINLVSNLIYSFINKYLVQFHRKKFRMDSVIINVRKVILDMADCVYRIVQKTLWIMGPRARLPRSNEQPQRRISNHALRIRSIETEIVLSPNKSLLRS